MLPTYDKTKRKKNFEALPKGAYVIKIMNAVEKPTKNNNGSYLEISFDIAEGDYAGYYEKVYKANTNEDKKWSNDAVYRLTVPKDDSKTFVWDNWNTFFADLEDSNNGFVFAGDTKSLRNKLIGGKFHIEQTSYNGNIYNHTRMKWTCVADDVRNNKAGRMPEDKLITTGLSPKTGADDFISIPEGVTDDELPFG
jgi:hypothetical protein